MNNVSVKDCENRSAFERLYRPIRIGNMEVKNRMVFPPMNTNYSNENGAVTAQMEEYYARRAEGGVGLVILEAVDVVSYSKNHGVQPMLYDNRFVPALANLVDRLHLYGAKASIEIAHYGAEAGIGRREGPSNITSKGTEVAVLSTNEIMVIEDTFAKSAAHAKTAGFDAITIHAAHGYLLGEFTSPLYNDRRDEYGGNTENRTRIVSNIIRKCKKTLGANYPIMVRISADEFIPGGIDRSEAVAIAAELEKAGADAIDVSGGMPKTTLFCYPPYSLPGYQGQFIPHAGLIKKAVSVPVICACGIRDPWMAEKILEENSADLVALGRTLIADPDFCNKALAGEPENIRPCLSCEYCVEFLEAGRGIRCTVNAEAGREYTFKGIGKTTEPQKVYVVGGGPAGMEAARVAALRGHEVALFEAKGQLGGTVNICKLPPGKEKMGELIAWYERQLVELDISIIKDKEFNASEYEDEDSSPDAIVYANGAKYSKPKGDHPNLVQAIEILEDTTLAKGDIVILGGGATGCETAELLAGGRNELVIKGIKDISGALDYDIKIHEDIPERKITIVEMLDEVCTDMDIYNKTLLLARLRENGVEILTGAVVTEIGSEGVTVKEKNQASQRLIQADTVVAAFGAKPQSDCSQILPGVKTFWAGDCNKVGKIADAVSDGYFAALSI
jgi:2,4-dienoyl-CoA reductase-like NADH-dependent reductase (Old Yellow Enzyme family)/NADPH-dependent 2,4-dienoyl-CoA reductase/sulfur reductase-like enzyme